MSSIKSSAYPVIAFVQELCCRSTTLSVSSLSLSVCFSLFLSFLSYLSSLFLQKHAEAHTLKQAHCAYEKKRGVQDQLRRQHEDLGSSPKTHLEDTAMAACTWNPSAWKIDGDKSDPGEW